MVVETGRDPTRSLRARGRDRRRTLCGNSRPTRGGERDHACEFAHHRSSGQPGSRGPDGRGSRSPNGSRDYLLAARMDAHPQGHERQYGSRTESGALLPNQQQSRAVVLRLELRVARQRERRHPRLRRRKQAPPNRFTRRPIHARRDRLRSSIDTNVNARRPPPRLLQLHRHRRDHAT